MYPWERRNQMRSLLTTALFTVFAAVAASAHHTASYIYDVEKPLLLTGVVTEVEWKNPHVLLHLNVKGSDGVTVNWLLEARAAYIMQRMGMTQEFIKTGETVDLTVCVTKDGSPKGGLQSVELPGVMKWVGECQPR
jgi:hypothetical protein